MPDIPVTLAPGTSKLLLTAGKFCNDDILISATLGATSGQRAVFNTDPNAFVFTLEPGAAKRLLTAGKYCDRNIIVTAEEALPSEYKEIEFIQTTGGAYIFLDFIPNANTNLKIVFSTTSANRCIFGCYERWGPLNAYAIWSHAVAFGNQPLLSLNLYRDGLTHTIEIIDGVYYLDGQEFFRYSGDYFESPVPPGVFALNRNGDAYEINGNMYLYGLEINGIKFPLCVNADGEIGIYNPTSKTFCTNQGSKALIAGPETSASAR